MLNEVLKVISADVKVNVYKTTRNKKSDGCILRIFIRSTVKHV